MYRIMIVEDDRGIAEGISTQAAKWGLEAETAGNFRNIMEDFARIQPHLVVLDIGLPFYNGFYWCAEIRKSSKVPILFLSSASDGMNMVMAMNMGADDFVAKPFDGSVLMAKIQALLRRAYDFGVASPTLEHLGAVLNTGTQTLSVGETAVELTKNEYRILHTLLQSKGTVVSRERLMEVLWQSDSFVDENTLTVNVNRLRKKLEAAGLKGFITTKVGSGYLVG